MMSLSQRKAYLSQIRKRYKKSSRKEKTLILDEFCSVCGYNRKYAIRLIKKRVLSKMKLKVQMLLG
jgi:hypothetical protein